MKCYQLFVYFNRTVMKFNDSTIIYIFNLVILIIFMLNQLFHKVMHCIHLSIIVIYIAAMGTYSILKNGITKVWNIIN
jgi:hypothetical protein